MSRAMSEHELEAGGDTTKKHSIGNNRVILEFIENTPSGFLPASGSDLDCEGYGLDLRLELNEVLLFFGNTPGNSNRTK